MRLRLLLISVVALFHSVATDAEDGEKASGMDMDIPAVPGRQHCPASDCAAAKARVSEISSRLETTAGSLDEMSTLLREVHDQVKQSGAGVVSPPVVRAYRDCSDLPAGTPSGVYMIAPGLMHRTPVFCDQDTDGGRWTVVQRRADILPHVHFFRGWDAYKWGFGALEGEFWWGLENIWRVTLPLDRNYELRIDMEDFESGRRFAVYDNFQLSSEADGYRLSATNFTGNGGDSLARHIGSRFSTRDRELSIPLTNCAETFRAGWWFKDCHDSNLNGLYLGGPHPIEGQGINWKTWRGYNYSLKHVEMKIRPVS